MRKKMFGTKINVSHTTKEMCLEKCFEHSGILNYINLHFEIGINIFLYSWMLFIQSGCIQSGDRVETVYGQSGVFLKMFRKIESTS